jgi:hypothetical protein
MRLSPTQVQDRADKARATTRVRAKTLEYDGYEIEARAGEAGIYDIRRPDGAQTYEVDLFNETCTCPLNFHHGDCKHLIATRAAVLKAIRLAAPLLPGLRPLGRL